MKGDSIMKNPKKSTVISIINLKGGVGKTITAINMAHCLAVFHDLKVLIIDNDKQGNTSKFFGCHSYDNENIADVLLLKCKMKDVIQKTAFENIDIIPSNMRLLQANKEVLLDSSKPQQNRFILGLQSVLSEYDICIFDNAPDINMSVINALTASDDVIIPVKSDEFTFDGVDIMLEQIADIRQYFNPKLKFKGCLLTNYRNNEVNNQSRALFKDKHKLFETKIRWTDKVDESTFAKMPIVNYSRRCGAARDYIAFVNEYLETVAESGTKGSGTNAKV